MIHNQQTRMKESPEVCRQELERRSRGRDGRQDWARKLTGAEGYSVWKEWIIIHISRIQSFYLAAQIYWSLRQDPSLGKDLILYQV